MGIYRVCKGSGNRVIKEGKIGFEGKIGRTPPGRVIFTIGKIRV